MGCGISTFLLWLCCMPHRISSGLQRVNSLAESTHTQYSLHSCVSHSKVSRELYGYTTSSLIPSWFGNTMYVSVKFFGKWSVSFSRIKEPNLEPVSPAIEWHSTNPCKGQPGGFRWWSVKPRNLSTINTIKWWMHNSTAWVSSPYMARDHICYCWPVLRPHL